MGTDSINLNLSEREITGKRVKALRRDGLVPAVVHNHGGESILAAGVYQDIEKAYHRAGKHAPVELTVGKEKHLAMIKDVDLEPTKRRVRHVVFQAINRHEKAEAEIPLHLVGEIPAERASLLVLKTLEHVEVEALPSDLPEAIEVDASVLAAVGDKITVADLKVPAGVTILTEPEQVIAMVEEPKVHEIETPPEAEIPEGEEAAEGEASTEDTGAKSEE